MTEAAKRVAKLKETVDWWVKETGHPPHDLEGVADCLEYVSELEAVLAKQQTPPETSSESELLRQANFILAVVATEEFCEAWSHYRDNAQAWLDAYKSLSTNRESLPSGLPTEDELLDKAKAIYESERHWFLTKNGVGLFSCGFVNGWQAGENWRLAQSTVPNTSPSNLQTESETKNLLNPLEIPIWDKWRSKMKILYNIRLAAVHDGKSTQEIVDAVIETANRHIEGLMSEVQDYVGELNKLIDEPKAEMQKRIRELEAEVERKETFAREEAARRFDAEERIRELEAKVDDLQTIRDNTPDWSNGYSAAWKEQEKAIVELRAERDLLRWKLKQFKVWGADDCATCDEGRVTLFVANTRCMTCDPEAYKVPEQLASKGGTEGTEGTDG